MKSFLLLAIFATLLSPALSAQNLPLDDFILQHKNEPGFTYAALSHDLFEVATKTEIRQEDWNGLHQVVKNIGLLSILATDSSAEAMSFYKEAKNLISREAFDELLAVRADNDHVRIWAKSEESTVSDLVLLVGSRLDFVLVRFSGQLELGDLSKLAELFEAGRATQLARQAHTVSMEFGLSPNPSNGQFTISFQEEQDTPAQLSLMGVNGQFLLSRPLTAEREQTITLQGIAPGTYWLQVKTRNGKVGVKQIQIVKG